MHPPERFAAKKPEIPTGRAREVSEALRERLLLFETVKNKVVFVNPEVDMPFKLEKGKESPLGLFAKSTIPEIFEGKPGQQRLETWPLHLRSALLGRVIFKDKQGRLYRDIDLKGIGFIWKKEIHIPGSPHETGGFYGLVESQDAFNEYNLSEKFLSTGIRTPRVLAIINLEELIFIGEKISLEKAMTIIGKKIHPVIEVRGFGTKARISDLVADRGRKEEIKKLLLEDAKKLVSQELGRGKNPLSTQEYLEWFAETLGTNIGLIHKNGWYHSNLISHNIPLDCRICDLDTVKELKTEENRKKDEDTAKSSFGGLAESLGFGNEWLVETLGFKGEEFQTQFQKGYEAVFPLKEREKFFAKKRFNF